MQHQPVIMRRILDAPIAVVWQAITDKNEMGQWFFAIDEFEPKTGVTFQFFGGEPGKKYLHICEVVEVVPYQKLCYSWRYDGYPGQSYVQFELEDQDHQTLLTLTHTGLESFPVTQPDFDRKNFEAGWNHFVNIALPGFITEKAWTYCLSIPVPASKVYEALTTQIASWWTADIQGAASHAGDGFTVRFGNTFKTMKIRQSLPGQYLLWEVTEAYIDLPEIKIKSEWVGTFICWEITSSENNTDLCLKHFGLTSTFECFAVCTQGWQSFIGSLKQFLLSGTGLPFEPENND